MLEMPNVIIHQHIDTKTREGTLLTTSIVDAETGEIYTQDIRIKNSYYMDSIVEAVIEEITRKAESMGKRVVAIDSPFLGLIEKRREMLNDFQEE